MTLILNFLLKAVKLVNFARALLSPLSSLARIFTDIFPTGDDYLFGNVQTKSGSQSIRLGSKLSYTRCREVLLKNIADVGLDPKSFSWHNLRSGGASAAANSGISDRMCKRHGGWRSENAKDGYVADSLESRLAVSVSLGL